MNNEIIKVNYENAHPTILGRDLHEALKINTKYNDWIHRMCEYGFVEGVDFNLLKIEQVQFEGTREVKRQITEHYLSIDMAKQICMIQRTELGKKYRQYFLELEKAWNTPEQVMARALKMAESTIAKLQENTKVLEAKIEQDKPKVIFADAVSASSTTILIRDLAKLLIQNGVKTGEKRLYKWLRDNGYIIKGSTQPTQRAMEMGLFEVVERSVFKSNDKNPIVTTTTKVTTKGQSYFINKLLLSQEA